MIHGHRFLSTPSGGNMRKFFAFLAGLMSGAIVGGVAALLFAPMSGEALKDEIAARIDQLKADMEKAAAEQEKKLRTEFERLKQA
jgi:gas vesicle protein